ncbi:MAG: hypothetical protein AAB433_22660 [Nitrospirota bacterium]
MMAVRRITPQQAERASQSADTFPGSVSGTYLRVTGHDYRENFDLPPELQYDVIYLLTSGRFAWLRYWSGFVYGRRAGGFTRQGADIQLEGRDTLSSDCLSENYERKPFVQALQLQQHEGSRILVGPLGEYSYLGFRVFIPFEGLGQQLFPQSWDELEEWVTRFVRPRAT